jgi:hypothetical protein
VIDPFAGSAGGNQDVHSLWPLSRFGYLLSCACVLAISTVTSISSSAAFVQPALRMGAKTRPQRPDACTSNRSPACRLPGPRPAKSLAGDPTGPGRTHACRHAKPAAPGKLYANFTRGRRRILHGFFMMKRVNFLAARREQPPNEAAGRDVCAARGLRARNGRRLRARRRGPARTCADPRTRRREGDTCTNSYLIILIFY